MDKSLALAPRDGSLPPENWGEQLHRAYRIARKREGGRLTYREVARRVSQVFPTTDASIVRLEGLESPPASSRQRELAIYCWAVYGFAPAQIGLDETNATEQELGNAVSLLGPLDT